MKPRLILFFIVVVLFTGCSSIKKDDSFKQDQYDALNDFLDTKIKDESEKIIIIKEVSKPDQTIEIFQGDYLVYPDTTYIRREGGVETPLYSKKDWLKMKNKYGGKNGETLISKELWDEEKFRYKNIEFLSKEQFRENTFSFKYLDSKDPVKEVYFLSAPLLYKSKYLTFSVFNTDTSYANMSPDDYIVVMKKVKGKWVIIQKVSSNIHY